MLKSIKISFASYLPEKILKILKFNQKKELTEDNQMKLNTDFEKDIYEVIGFQNGLKPHTDIREGTGMLGLQAIIHFIDTIK